MDTQFPHTAREPAASHSFQVYPHLVCGPSGSREVKACRRSGKPGSSCHSRRAFSPFLELHRDSTSASPSFPSSNMAPRRGRQSPSLTYSQPPAGAHMGDVLICQVQTCMLLPLWEPCVPVGLQVGARKPLQLLGAAAVLTQGGAASDSEMVGQAGLQSDCRHLGLHLPWVRLRRTGCPFPGCEPAAPSGRSRPHTASGGKGCELTGLLGNLSQN